MLQELISRIKKGDEEGITAFIRFSLPYIKRITSRFNPSREDQEEWIDLILMHTLDQIINGKFEFITTGAFHSWLFKMATRKCIQLWRRGEMHRVFHVDHDKLDTNPHPGVDTPLQKMERMELTQLIENAMEDIPNLSLRRTLQMSLLNGWSVHEIALKTGRPVNTIRTWERRGKAVLREILERKHPEILDSYGS